MSRPAELRELPGAELTARLESAKEELFNLRFQLATGQLDNPMRLKQVRHEVARILTVLRQRELGIEPEVAKAVPTRRLRRRRAAEPEPEAEATGAPEGEEEPS